MPTQITRLPEQSFYVHVTSDDLPCFNHKSEGNKPDLTSSPSSDHCPDFLLLLFCVVRFGVWFWFFFGGGGGGRLGFLGFFAFCWFFVLFCFVFLFVCLFCFCYFICLFCFLEGLFVGGFFVCLLFCLGAFLGNFFLPFFLFRFFHPRYLAR